MKTSQKLYYFAIRSMISAVVLTSGVYFGARISEIIILCLIFASLALGIASLMFEHHEIKESILRRDALENRIREKLNGTLYKWGKK